MAHVLRDICIRIAYVQDAIEGHLYRSLPMRPYSNDLRERIVNLIDQREYSLRQIARLFSVSLSFVVRLLQQRRRTGSIQPRPHGGGPASKLDDVATQRLLELVRQHPEVTLGELRDQLGVCCDVSTIARALQRHRTHLQTEDPICPKHDCTDEENASRPETGHNRP